MDSFSLPRLDVVLGSRREVLHLAPIIHELRQTTTMQVRLISILTKQKDVLDALDSLSLRPDIQWSILGTDHNSGTYFGEISILLSELWRTQKAKWLLSFGHSEIMVAAVVTAFQNQVPVAHLEDVNIPADPQSDERHADLAHRLVSILSDLHFTPSVQAKNQLIHNGISENMIYSVGSTLPDARCRLFENFSVTDTLRNVAHQWTTEKQEQLINGKFFAIDLHSNQCLNKIVELLPQIHEHGPDILPLIVANGSNWMREFENLIEGLPLTVIHNPKHLQRCALLLKAKFIMTDSEDTLEECAAYGSKCFLLQDQTSRIDLVSSGVVSMNFGKAEFFSKQLKILLFDSENNTKSIQKAQASGSSSSASLKIVEALTNQTDGNVQREKTLFRSRSAG